MPLEDFQGHTLDLSEAMMGERLRKSVSYEVPAMKQEEESTTSSTSDEKAELSFHAKRLHSASLNQIKRSNAERELTVPGDDQQSGPPSSKMNSLADDDVFTDAPHQSFFGDSQSPFPRRGGRDPTKFMGAVDPQGIYPPSACIFVANLTQMESDETLEAEVTRIFSEFGTVFVKIRRDQKNMPFAFCQFTTDQDAREAVAYSTGRIILGRPCRVEKAKANSTFIVYKNSQQPTDHTEAYLLMEPLGEIGSVEPLDVTIQLEMNVPPAMLVQFKMYDSRRDVRLASRRDPRFVVREYEPVVVSPRNRRDNETRAEEMVEYDRDRRSAYFGNLPLDMTEEELTEMAIACGQLRQRRVYQKTYKGGPTAICFAFVEFTRPDSVDDVIRTYHGMEIRGHIIKVERKQSRCFVDNQERESRVPNKLSSHAQASKQWRGSEFSYPESSRAAYTPPMMRSRYVHESPMGNFATTPLSSPSESTHERAATLGYRRSRPSIFPSPAGQSGSQRGHAYGTPTRAAYSSSTYGSVRASVPGRRHVRDIFNPPDEHHDERDGHAFRDQEAMISAHRRSFATPDKTNTLGAGLVDTGNTVARGSPLRSSWAHSRIDPAKIGATGKLAKAEYSPSEDGTDNEPGGALFSPGSEASTLASMPNLPDISRMFISDASAMSNMEQGHHHSPPYYDYPPMGGYNMQPIGNSLAAMGPMTGPMTPYSHQSTSSMNGSLNWMQYLPTPRPEYYGPVMWPLYPHPLPTAGEQEPGQLTPTRIAHSHSHSRMRGRDNEVQQMAGAEPSPSRGTDVGRLQARCHARRESMETQYEPKCSNDSRDGNSKK